MARTDTHSPAQFDPADYIVIGYIDNKRPEPPCEGGKEAWEAYEEYVAWWQEQVFQYFPDWRTGGDDHRSIFQCNHCGHQGIRYVAVVEHRPTGAKLAFGEICAERCELAGRDDFRKKYIFDQAKRAQAAYAKTLIRTKFASENTELVTWLKGQAEAERQGKRVHEFVLSLAMQLHNKGELSEKQVVAASKFMARDLERQAKWTAEAEALLNVAPLIPGRQTLEGVIVSTKWQDSDYNIGCLKMTVKLDDGNRVWGTVPRNVDYYLVCSEENGRLDTLVGQRVRFTAEVTPKTDDPHFGFFKRPANAQLVR